MRFSLSKGRDGHKRAAGQVHCDESGSFRRNQARAQKTVPPESPQSDYFRGSNTVAPPVSAVLQALRGIIDRRQALLAGESRRADRRQDQELS